MSRAPYTRSASVGGDEGAASPWERRGADSPYNPEYPSDDDVDGRQRFRNPSPSDSNSSDSSSTNSSSSDSSSSDSSSSYSGRDYYTDRDRKYKRKYNHGKHSRKRDHHDKDRKCRREHGHDRHYSSRRDRKRENRSRSREHQSHYQESHYHKERGQDSHHRERSPIDCKDKFVSDLRRSGVGEWSDQENEGLQGPGNGLDEGLYKTQVPNTTITAHGLAQHIKEDDIRHDILACGLMAKHISVLRVKNTGASRGLAYVEFTTLQDARRWMHMKQGVLILHGKYRAVLQYNTCTPSDGQQSVWFCAKCWTQNFKIRQLCYKCGALPTETSDEVCDYPTKTIVLRNLDALSSEETVMAEIKKAVPHSFAKITGVRISRDSFTSVSRGICYLGVESMVDALALYRALTSLMNPLCIDGKIAVISYCKYHMGEILKPFVRADPLTPTYSNVRTMNGVTAMAEYTASCYASSGAELQHYIQYYKIYFAQHLRPDNIAADIAQKTMKDKADSERIKVVPTGIDGKTYDAPDVTKYFYDARSGFYYDPSTGLYYDKNTEYYYNGFLQKYLYWDAKYSTYLLAPTSDTNMSTVSPSSYASEPVYIKPAVATVTSASSSSAEDNGPFEVPDNKQRKAQPKDPQKVSDKILKDMARWAKSYNQMKEGAKSRQPNENNKTITSPVADIDNHVLEKLQSTARRISTEVQGDSDDSSDSSVQEDNSEHLIDWQKLACFLCRRQFSSKEFLTMHMNLSIRHKRNLELMFPQKKVPELMCQIPAMECRNAESYETPSPDQLKEHVIAKRTLVASMSPLGTENLRNRFPRRIGWEEEQRLGKDNQGRAANAKVSLQPRSPLLGAPLLDKTDQNYVKRLLAARFKELSEED